MNVLALFGNQKQADKQVSQMIHCVLTSECHFQMA
jgi:hypothetical protein